jgi:Tol biopolymer transport system component
LRFTIHETASLRLRAAKRLHRSLWRARAAAALALFLLTPALACAVGQPPIIFTSDRDGNLEIYSIQQDGGDAVNLTQSIADEFAPVLSPNGKLVAFLSGSADTVSLEVMQVDGAERQQLTTGPGRLSSHSWSPASNRLAYVFRKDGTTSLWVGSIGGTEPLLLTAIAGDDIGGWSSDGKSVAFVVPEGDGRGIYRRNPDGVNEFRLTDTPDYSPVWSPDSKRFAFISTRDGKQKRVTENESADYALSWSPDGKRLLFVSEQDGNAEIYVTEPDVTGHDRLTHNEVKDDEPVWSPNGRWIAFVSYLDGDAEIFVMDVDGGSQSRLTTNGFADTSPSW